MDKRTILLVDDDDQIIEQFERALKREGYAVDTAMSGEEAWEKYQARFYDVVIADWQMGEMNGIELLQKIDEIHPFAKVIMITGAGDEKIAIEAHHYHAFDYVTKPVNIDDFLQRVAEAIRRKDGVITALEDWVATHPDETSRPLKATLEQGEVKMWSAKDVLEEIKNNTEQGRKEYQKLVKLTIDLLTREKIK